MTRKIQQIAVAADVLVYIRSALGHGRTLSQEVSKLTFDASKVFALLSSKVSQDKANRFRAGGVARVAETEAAILDIVVEFLARGGGRLAIFEDVMARPADPSVLRAGLPFVAYGEDVYYVCSADADRGALRDALRAAKSHLLLIVLSHAEDADRMKTLRELSRLELTSLAQASEFLIVGAYDGEAALVVHLEPAAVPAGFGNASKKMSSESSSAGRELSSSGIAVAVSEAAISDGPGSRGSEGGLSNAGAAVLGLTAPANENLRVERRTGSVSSGPSARRGLMGVRNGTAAEPTADRPHFRRIGWFLLAVVMIAAAATIAAVLAWPDKNRAHPFKQKRAEIRPSFTRFMLAASARRAIQAQQRAGSVAAQVSRADLGNCLVMVGAVSVFNLVEWRFDEPWPDGVRSFKLRARDARYEYYESGMCRSAGEWIACHTFNTGEFPRVVADIFVKTREDTAIVGGGTLQLHTAAGETDGVAASGSSDDVFNFAPCPTP